MDDFSYYRSCPIILNPNSCQLERRGKERKVIDGQKNQRGNDWPRDNTTSSSHRDNVQGLMNIVKISIPFDWLDSLSY